MKMKIGIIIPGEIDSNHIPYIKYFTDILDQYGKEYEFICWNRLNSDSEKYKQSNVHCFNLYSPDTNNFIIKIIHFLLFSNFVIKKIKKNKFDLLIVHTIIIAIFLSSCLNKKYKSKFIFDIRDYSPVVPYTRRILKRIISNSFFTSISSKGFLKWLPSSDKYVLSHNIDKKLITSYCFKNEAIKFHKKNFQVLTIGHLRNFETNVRLMNDLGNFNGIQLVFAGGGIFKEKLERFSGNKFSNVLFTGKYKKVEENQIVENADFLNILLPINILESTLVSNRFYLSVINNKPMIVNSESYQSKIVSQFNLGLIIGKDENIKEKIENYISKFDINTYRKGCDEFIRIVREDILIFEDKIKLFLQIKENKF